MKKISIWKFIVRIISCFALMICLQGCENVGLNIVAGGVAGVVFFFAVMLLISVINIDFASKSRVQKIVVALSGLVFVVVTILTIFISNTYEEDIRLIKENPKISSCLNYRSGFSNSYSSITIKQPFIIMRKGDKEWKLIYYSEKKRLDENAINNLNAVVVVKDGYGISHQYGGGNQGRATLYIHDAEITYFDFTNNQYYTDRISNERSTLPWGIHDDRHEYVNNNTIIEEVKLHNDTNQLSITHDEGVVINGVKWATRNVNAPHTFAASPENAGMFYQWNRKIGWSVTDPIINSNGKTEWDNTEPTGVEWTADNDPSPNGWRVPTYEEMESLLDSAKVSNKSTTQNGVLGIKFTDTVTGKSIFMPAVGRRYCESGINGYYTIYGYYWSNKQIDIDHAVSLYFYYGYVGFGSKFRGFGYSVRSVANSE